MKRLSLIILSLLLLSAPTMALDRTLQVVDVCSGYKPPLKICKDCPIEMGREEDATRKYKVKMINRAIEEWGCFIEDYEVLNLNEIEETCIIFLKILSNNACLE